MGEAMSWKDLNDTSYPEHGPWIVTELPKVVYSPPHVYNWKAMRFNPAKDIMYGFDWDVTPEGFIWWAENEDSLVGFERHAEMKQLFAADMARASRLTRAIIKIKQRFFW